MYFYAARQAILDKNKNLFAYELLFRDSLDNIFPCVDADEATSKVVEASQFTLGLSEFTGNKPAFINFTQNTLIQGFPEILSNDEVVIEILETVKPGKKLLSICKDLHKKGYIIALDHYQHQRVWIHFYPYINILKIDIQQTNLEEIKIIFKEIKAYPHIKLLAEKVETLDDYKQMKQLGFEYFQGFFFAKPEVVKAKNLSPTQIAMAELLYETSKTELDLNSVTRVFERDVALSYKLLRYANSAMFKRRSEISTIKQALVILGSSELKKFLGLMFAVTANPDKPVELIKMAMGRAKFCELVTQHTQLHVDSSIAFLTGLLSMIDAILDEEMSSVLEKLPLVQEIKEPLLTRKGVLAALIKLVEHIEKAQWKHAAIAMVELKLEKESVIKQYNKSLLWADEQI